MRNEEEIKELEEKIRYHNRKYFLENSPEISDQEYDKLVQLLESVAPRSLVLKEIADSLQLNRFDKIERSFPMLSLQKCYSEDEVEKWAKEFKCSFMATAKIDGCAIEIIYDENGELVLAATRGDGYVGEDVTLNAKTIEDIPHKIAFGPLEIRGEVYMRNSVFEKFKDEFANPRNLAAGGLRQKNPSECEKYNLSFLAYDIIGLSEIARSEEEEDHKFAALEELGFQTPYHLCIVNGDSLQAAYEWIASKRHELDYEIDGVVFKASNRVDQANSGFTSHHPRYAIAYKFQGESEITTLQEVKWQPSRNGRITPVGLVAPVRLSGAIVTKVTLHNWRTFNELNLRDGAKVLITRSGGVIPYFEKVVENGNGESILWPEQCPACGRVTEFDGDFLVCSNPAECVGAHLQRLEHFMSVLDCEGFGPSMIERLYRAGLVRKSADFYRLQLSDLTQVEGVAETLAQKLLKNIQERSVVPLEDFLTSLGILGLGKQTAKAIVKRFKDFQRIMAATQQEFMAIDGIGEITAQTVYQDLHSRSDVIELLDVIEIQNPENPERPKSAISGKSFLFTGTLAAMKRDEAEKLVESKGGEISGSVNKDLDYLVVGDLGGAGSKVEKAVKLQEKGGKVQVIPEAVWLNMMMGETLSNLNV